MVFQPALVEYKDPFAGKKDPYEYLNSRSWRFKADIIVDFLRYYYSEPFCLLEVGCAEGLMTERLALSVLEIHVIALDCSLHCVQRATARCKSYSNVSILHHDVTAMPLPSHDVMLLVDVLYYMVNEDEVYHSLSPGALVIFSSQTRIELQACGASHLRSMEEIDATVPHFMECIFRTEGPANLRVLRRRGQ